MNAARAARRFWIAAAILLGLMLVVAPFDGVISRWMRMPDRAGPLLDQIYGFLGLPTACLLLIVVLTGFDNWRRVLPALLAPVIVANLVTELIKRIVGRARPDQGLGAWALDAAEWWSGDGAWQSFPSGHATAAGAVAACLAYVLPRWRWYFIAWGVAVALGRVVAQRHFLSDVLMGAGLGVLVTLVCVRLMGRGAFRLRRREADGPGPGWGLIAGAAAAVLVAVAASLPLDQRITGWLAASGLAPDQPLERLGDVLLQVVCRPLEAVFGGVLLFALLGQRKDWRFAYAFLVASVVLTQVPTQTLKFLIGRARPNLEAAPGPYTFRPAEWENFWERWNSFPSGHSSYAASVALVLGALFPHGRVWLWLVAGVFMLERVPSGWHWPSDVFGGALVALVSVDIVRRTLPRRTGAHPVFEV